MKTEVKSSRYLTCNVNKHRRSHSSGTMQQKKSQQASSMETEVFSILALCMSFSKSTCILLKRIDAYLAARETKDLLIFLKILFSNEERFQALRLELAAPTFFSIYLVSQESCQMNYLVSFTKNQSSITKNQTNKK